MREDLLIAIQSFSNKHYQISFQFWGDGNNNVFIMKDHVDLYSSGGFSCVDDVIIDALHYLYRINRTPNSSRVC